MRSIAKATRSGLRLGAVALGLAAPLTTPGLAHGTGIPLQEEVTLPCDTAKGICSKKLYTVPGNQQLEVHSVLCHFAAATDIVYRAFLQLDTTPHTYLAIPQLWLKVHNSILFSDFRLKTHFIASPWQTLTLAIHYRVTTAGRGAPWRMFIVASADHWSR